MGSTGRVSLKLIYLTKIVYKKVQGRVQLNEMTLTYFEMKKEIEHDGSLSLLFFISVMDIIIKT